MDNHFGKPEKPKKNKLLQIAFICVAVLVGMMMLMAFLMLLPSILR